MSRVVALVVAMLLVLAGPAMADSGVIEQLRLGVPEPHRELWLQAEASIWQP
ncbi:MAG: TIGR03792 family protein, partial [Synechococcus sp. MED850]